MNTRNKGNAMNKINTLTPADEGFLGATLDDAREANLGYDETLNMLITTAMTERMGFSYGDCVRVAHDFLIQTLNKEAAIA